MNNNKHPLLVEGIDSKVDCITYDEYIESLLNNLPEEQIDKELEIDSRIARALKVSKAYMKDMCIIVDTEDEYSPDWQNYSSKDRVRGVESAFLYTVNEIKIVETHDSGITYLWFANSSDATLYIDSVRGDIKECKDASKEDQLLEDKSEKIELEYPDLEIEAVVRRGNPAGYYDKDFGNWLPDEDEFDTVKVDYTYKVDKDDIINYLAEECVTLSDKDDWYDIDNEEADKWVIDNFDMLVNKYRYKILDHFEDAAKEEAHNKYSFNSEEN